METTAQLATLAIDGHVHIYPQYDWAKAITALITNLTASTQPDLPAQAIVPIGLLAESKANRFFRDVIDRGAPLINGPLQVEAGPDSDSLVIRLNGVLRGYLIAGRQLVTREKLEVLALGKDSSLPDGQSLPDALQAISELHAIPVISWSPGKWFFGRGKLVSSCIHTHSPGSFLMGDIGLRPTVWGEPRLMKQARQCGFKIIGGSDALPLAGEELWIGTTGFKVTGKFDPQKPAASIREFLTQPGTTCVPIGNQSSLCTFASRWGRNQLKAR